jgi:hypothetical protein
MRSISRRGHPSCSLRLRSTQRPHQCDERKAEKEQEFDPVHFELSLSLPCNGEFYVTLGTSPHPNATLFNVVKKIGLGVCLTNRYC